MMSLRAVSRNDWGRKIAARTKVAKQAATAADQNLVAWRLDMLRGKKCFSAAILDWDLEISGLPK